MQHTHRAVLISSYTHTVHAQEPATEPAQTMDKNNSAIVIEHKGTELKSPHTHSCNTEAYVGNHTHKYTALRLVASAIGPKEKLSGPPQDPNIMLTSWIPCSSIATNLFTISN